MMKKQKEFLSDVKLEGNQYLICRWIFQTCASTMIMNITKDKPGQLDVMQTVFVKMPNPDFGVALPGN